MHWRVIPYSTECAVRNMALDEAILEAFLAGEAPPTVRFYGWNQPSVTIGRLQPASSIPEGWGRCPIVRRPTGGRAVAHGSDLTFSIVVDGRVLGSAVRESYRRVGDAVARALVKSGVPAEFCRNTTPPETVRGIGRCFDLTLEYELAVNGQKMLGSAQVRRSGAVLQQNSLLLPAEALMTPSELVPVIVEAIESQFDVSLYWGEFSESELQIAGRLADNKYASDCWNRLGETMHSDAD